MLSKYDKKWSVLHVFGVNFPFNYALNYQIITIITFLCLHNVLKWLYVTLMPQTVDLNAQIMKKNTFSSNFLFLGVIFNDLRVPQSHQEKKNFFKTLICANSQHFQI